MARDDDRKVERHEDDEKGQDQQQHGRRVVDAECRRGQVEKIAPQGQHEERAGGNDPD